MQGLRLACGSEVDADLVVIAAGIRPNVELGRKAGLEVRRGIVVNDYLETSHPDVYAVGECTEHRGETFGLVAPLLEQGKVLAATITGNRGPEFTGATPAAKLKIMGVDVYSAGNVDDSDPATEVIRYEDPALGIYKKLLVRNNRLIGVILVGDASDDHRYAQWLRNGTDLTEQRRHLLFSAARRRQRCRRRVHPRFGNRVRLHGRHQGRHHPCDPRTRHLDDGPAQGPDARVHRLRQLWRDVFPASQGRGARI